MPMYTYSCLTCDVKTVRMCKIADRDEQHCDNCEEPLKRGLDRPGSVWAPTARSGGHAV